jgi:hypothetical protein
MKLKRYIVLGAISALVWSEIVTAQSVPTDLRLPDIPSFTPSLTINENPQVCAAFKMAWMDVYNSDKTLRSVHVDLHAAYPKAEQVFPPEGKTKEKPHYEYGQGVSLDYDDDGDEEILHMIRDVSNWRSTAVRMFLYDNRADFDADAVAEDDKDRHTPRSRFGYRNTENTNAKVLATYPSLDYPHVFKMNGKVYSKSDVLLRSGMPISASLDILRPGEEAKPVCEVELTGPHSPGSSAVLETYSRLSQIYGGPETGGMCYGTMGWTAKPIYSHLPDLFYRPQAMRELHGTQIDMSPEADTAREFRFAAWGIEDPSSLSVVEALKDSYPKFIAEMSLYYQVRFEMDETQARTMAERGYRYLLDNVYYARQSGLQWWDEDYVGLEVGPAISLSDMTAQALSKANAEEKGSLSLLKLGLMTGQPTEALIPLTERLLSDEHWLFKDSDEDAKTMRKTQMIKQMFLASLNSPKMMKLLLDKGADVDWPTNYFGKTALMYAAQNNNVEATMLLLENGANPNTQTQSEGHYCQSPLIRDARTPLMYAVENADPQLILTLLDAGADKSVKDSKDNDIFWYLERNSSLNETEKDLLRTRLRL